MTNAQLNNKFNLTEAVLDFLLSCGFSVVADHVDMPIPYLDYNTGDAHNYYSCIGLYNREYDNYYYLVSFSDTDSTVFNNIMLLQHNYIYGDFYINFLTYLIVQINLNTLLLIVRLSWELVLQLDMKPMNF